MRKNNSTHVRRVVCVVLNLALAGGAAMHAQPATASSRTLQWDVISVKPMSPDACPANQGGVGWLKDGLTASCVPLAFVVESAYHLFDSARIVGLPEWSKDPSQVYAIEARVSGEDAAAFNKLSREEKLGMMQLVLADRFHMKAHMEPRPMPAYDLVIAKGGPKLIAPEPNESGTSQFGAPTGDVKWVDSPLTNLMFLLGRETGRPVVDKTGLTEKYDFTLAFTPAARAATDDSGRPSVFTALEEQLGLKLVPAKEPVDVLVIDSIEQPAMN
jgi:uncharacterized protein (TIGR03435 family)